MYVKCPRCNKVIIHEYYLSDIYTDKSNCPKCGWLIDPNKDKYDVLLHNVKCVTIDPDKCDHLDHNDNFNEATITTMSGRHCRYCGKYIGTEEYRRLLRNSRKLKREHKIIEE